MAQNSKIEWTDHTFNLVIGCAKVSPKFQQWLKLESSRVLAGHRSIEAMVEQAVQEQMQPQNLKIEVRSEEGWVEAK